MLSEANLIRLRKEMKPKDFIPVLFCSKCNKGPEEMQKIPVHALQQDYDDCEEEDKIKYEARIQRSSRCCGAKFNIVYKNYFEMLYDLWTKLDKSETAASQFLPFYQSVGRNYSPEFMVVQQTWGLGDRHVNLLIEVFSEEDRRCQELSSIQIQPEKRKRGRPKGSKNKTKLGIPS